MISTLWFACSNTKFLQKDELLYNDTQIRILDEQNNRSKKGLEGDLRRSTYPKPNRKVMGLWKWNLWVYNRTQKHENGIGGWIKEHIGEQPALLDSTQLEASVEQLRKKLFRKGFFYSEVEYETKIEGKKAEAIYTVKLNRPYMVNKVYWPEDDTESTKLLLQSKNESLLEEGVQFNTGMMSGERNRIVRWMNDRGYYDYNKNYIYFDLDSSKTNHTIDIYLRHNQPNGRENKADTLHQQYTINKVYIVPGKLSDEIGGITDTLEYRDYTVLQSGKQRFKPKLFDDFLLIRPGRLYSKKYHEYTLSHLLGLDAFRFVDIRYPNVGDGKLDCYIFLTPSRKMQMAAEVEIDNKSERYLGNGFIGTALSFNYKNRNVFKKAEQFHLDLFGGVQFDRISTTDFINTVDVTAQASFTFPKFLVPFRLNNVSQYFKPSTQISLSSNYVKRISYYDLTSTNLSFSYDWKESERKRHILTPINLNFVKLLRTDSLRFDTLEAQNPLFAKSIEDQFIIGGNYTFTYTNRVVNSDQNFIFFMGNLELAGNALSVLDAGLKPGSEKLQILGNNYSQFTRIHADFRHYNLLPYNTSLVSRVVLGVGVPYGNSTVLPYFKQFFVGGPNSVRGFRLRGLGPGEQLSENELEHTGEVKIESNLEYRFGLISYIKGAIFLDAGNVWLLDKQAEVGGFSAKDMFAEMGVGTGFGLRLDFTYFIIRGDLAFPIRKPFLPAGDRWTIHKIEPLSRSWRADNLTLNLAIGYPF